MSLTAVPLSCILALFLAGFYISRIQAATLNVNMNFIFFLLWLTRCLSTLDLPVALSENFYFLSTFSLPMRRRPPKKTRRPLPRTNCYYNKNLLVTILIRIIHITAGTPDWWNRVGEGDESEEIKNSKVFEDDSWICNKIIHKIAERWAIDKMKCEDSSSSCSSHPILLQRKRTISTLFFIPLSIDRIAWNVLMWSVEDTSRAKRSRTVWKWTENEHQENKLEISFSTESSCSSQNVHSGSETRTEAEIWEERK